MCAWHVNQSLELGNDERAFAGKMQLLDKGRYNSVTTAVASLNNGTCQCGQGFCAVYSTSKQRYFILYRSDKQGAAENALRGTAPVAAARPAAVTNFAPMTSYAAPQVPAYSSPIPQTSPRAVTYAAPQSPVAYSVQAPVPVTTMARPMPAQVTYAAPPAVTYATPAPTNVVYEAAPVAYAAPPPQAVTYAQAPPTVMYASPPTQQVVEAMPFPTASSMIAYPSQQQSIYYPQAGRTTEVEVERKPEAAKPEKKKKVTTRKKKSGCC